MQYIVGMRKLSMALTVVLALAAAPCFGQFTFSNMMQKQDNAGSVDTTTVDWSQEFIYAVGDGVISSDESNTSKSYQKAQGEGKMKAVAGLLGLLESTPLNYKSTGSEYISKDQSLRDKIEERLAGVEVVNEKQVTENGEMVVKVTVRVPMYGASGVGSAVLQSVFQREMTPMGAPAGLTIEKKGDPGTSTIEASASGPFTSLIVDCTGLKIDRALNPKLRKTDGTELWGTPGMNSSFLQNHGAVCYVKGLDEAKRNSLAGANPLIIQAAGRAGSKFMCDPIISNPDADRAASENQTARFMDKFNVIFVLNEE